MLYGGIYGYPADKTNKTGKLRLLYECAPMSFIMEQVSHIRTSTFCVMVCMLHDRQCSFFDSSEDCHMNCYINHEAQLTQAAVFLAYKSMHQ